MILSHGRVCIAVLACLGAVAPFAAPAAEPPVAIAAHYNVTMTHVKVGQLSWTINLSDASYITSAKGTASGVLSVLVKGEGAFTTRGAIAGAQLTPAVARSDINDDDGTYETEMTFENGALKRVEDRGAAPPKDRIAVDKKFLRDVTDPLSAMLIASAQSAMAPANCRRTLKIYDGRRRYDLALSFKRTATMKMARGYAGPVLVCAVVLEPIGGYKPDSMLVRYLAGKDDLEMWFAPIKGAPFLLPVRALMPTLVGTMDIEADEFIARSVETTPTAAEAGPVAPAKPVESAPLAPPSPGGASQPPLKP
jgi:hypothetical protein